MFLFFGRTDTMCENNDHRGGLVGQKRIQESYYSFPISTFVADKELLVKPGIFFCWLLEKSASLCQRK